MSSESRSIPSSSISVSDWEKGAINFNFFIIGNCNYDSKSKGQPSFYCLFGSIKLLFGGGQLGALFSQYSRQEKMQYSRQGKVLYLSRVKCSIQVEKNAVFKSRKMQYSSQEKCSIHVK
jgi:hypothetical protein